MLVEVVQVVMVVEGNVLFNDALNTFYLRLYGVRHMVKDHSDSERENPQPQHGLSLRLAARVLLYASFHRQGYVSGSSSSGCIGGNGVSLELRNASLRHAGKHCTQNALTH